MGDNGASGLPSGWRVEIDGGSLLPQGAYSMIEVDALTCAFEQLWEAMCSPSKARSGHRS